MCFRYIQDSEKSSLLEPPIDLLGGGYPSETDKEGI